MKLFFEKKNSLYSLSCNCFMKFLSTKPVSLNINGLVGDLKYMYPLQSSIAVFIAALASFWLNFSQLLGLFILSQCYITTMYCSLK